MLCIFRPSAALRPLTRVHQFSSILYHCPRPRYHNRSFSQSPQCLQNSQRPARPKKQYTPEQLAAFKNHYATLGLSNTATDRDIKTAYNKLSLRFHPDMMRNVDSKEYWDNPDRPEFIKIKEAYEILSDPAKRRAYDAEYNDILRAAQRLRAEQKAAMGIDTKKAIAANLRLDYPTIHPDGSPVRDHCAVQISDLPPQATIVDVLRAIAAVGPVGRIIDARLLPPSHLRVGRTAFIELPNDACAQRLGLLLFQDNLNVLRKKLWHCILMVPTGKEQRLKPPPRDPGATRVLVVDGPRGHRLMTTGALGEFFDSVGLKNETDSYRVVDSAGGPNRVAIEWVFTSWRRAAVFASRDLRRECPELTVTYGKDPCE